MKSVCVIDDDPILQKIMSRMIQNFDESLEISSFQDGQNAIDQLAKKDKLPDLIFLDINMPKMDAWGFLDELDKITSEDLPIYILTSSIDQRDIDKADSISRVKKYLIKPMKKQELHDICALELG